MSDEHALTGDQRTVAEAVGIANAPLTASDLATVTGLAVDAVLAAGDELIATGWLIDDALGYGPTTQAAELEISHARRTEIKHQIAAAVGEGRPALSGRLFVEAGEQRQGFEILANAALSGGPVTEARHNLAQAALAAAEGLDLPDNRLGHVHLVAGQYQKSMGNSEEAGQSFAAAALLLTGTDRINALRFCAATADDFQHPQEAERWLAAAEYEAVKQDETGQYGSLLAMHALTLSRIGFPAEADAALEKGRAIARTDPDQDRLSAKNEAEILLDRGYARQAEAAFASLSFQAERDGNPVGAAFFRVYHARALFAAGKVNEAIALLDGIVNPDGALLFLKQLALTEGAVWFERWDEATDLARDLTEIIAREVPQWENIGRFYLAKSLLGKREIAESREQLNAALSACPPGTDGWRWRLRCLALEMALSHAESQSWDQTAAENLTDELLVARWFDVASDLMINRANIEDDEELARQAAGLASSLGNPTLAIRAAHAADLWTDSLAAEVVGEARSTAANLTDPAREQWSALPHVAAALAAEPQEANPDDTSLIDELNETLTAIGLAGSGDLLTPAQRQQSGLVRRRPTVRKAGRWLGIAAGIAAVIAVSVVTALALQPEAPTAPGVTVIVTASTSTIPLTVEQTQLPAPADKLTGGSVDGGDFARSGVTDASGVDQPGGFYWRFTAGDVIRSTPVSYGNWIYFGSQDFDIYALNQTTGEVYWTLSTGGAVLGTGVVGQIALSEGAISQGNVVLLVIGSDDGYVWARNAQTGGNDPEFWKYPIGEAVRTTPVFSDNLVIVTGGDGRVHGIRGADGEAAWVYPSLADEPVAPFDNSPALSNGIIYAGDTAGVMHLIDAVTGELICNFDSRSRVTTPPSIVNGVVYFGNASTVFQLPEGECPPGITNAGGIPTRANFDVTVFGDQLLMPDGVAVYAYELPGGASADRRYEAGSDVSSASIIANNTLYFGDQNGVLYAVDASTLEEMWKFQTGGRIVSAPAVGDGVIFVASGSELWAIGPEAP